MLAYGIFLCLALFQRVHSFKCVMYLTGQHNVVPELSLVSDVTHVALAFMPSSTFNRKDNNTSDWPLFTTVNEVRPKFSVGTSIIVAVGGWGDTHGFSEAALTDDSRKLFAQNIKRMVEDTGADGVDVDWEYPGGNGDDYKQIPNSEKAWEVEAYPKLLEEIRKALAPEKLITAAVPGLPRDMIAFTKDTIPTISASIDFFNVMTYDLMNRRDTITKHHTGLQLSIDSINAYLENGAPSEKLNLGFAYYIKWFKTSHLHDEECAKHPIGCQAALMEDPSTGADLGQAGAFSWHDEVPSELAASFARAKSSGEYDTVGGGYYFWDLEERIFWSWDTPEAIQKKFPAIMDEKQLGGVFAWGLGEDAPEFAHLQATVASLQKYLPERPGDQWDTACGRNSKDEL
ncbi:glycoside hydrolase superfamily [Aspergillus cavernicola]|uniref:chitinase n=1 Tax=Aspergillus cavernicola TaxID=176166 RepID=A0ABR4HP82_9EURO